MATILRKPKNQKKYTNYCKQHKDERNNCDFCTLLKGSEIIESNVTMFVMRSNFPYDFWENCKVTEHLLIIPKRHIYSMTEFNAQEVKDYFKIVSKYEARGYNVYSRGVSAATRSRLHMHTHFIKFDGKPKPFTLYIKKPHILITK